MISISFTNKRIKRKVYGIAGALLTLAIPYFLLRISHGHLDGEQSLCPFKMLTGFPCPGCGITKSLIALYEGNLLTSINYHLFGPLVFVFCLAAIIILSIEILSDRELFQNILFSKKLAYTLGITLATYHFIRLAVFISTTNFSDILQQSIWK